MKLFVYSNMICISWTFWQVVLGIKIGAPIFNSAQSTALSSRDVNPKMCSFVMPFLLLSIETILFSLHIALLTAYGLWLQPGVFKSSVFVGFKRWGCKHAPTISDGRQAREADKPLMPAGYAENEPTSPYSIAVRNTFIDTWACSERTV